MEKEHWERYCYRGDRCCVRWELHLCADDPLARGNDDDDDDDAAAKAAEPKPEVSG